MTQLSSADLLGSAALKLRLAATADYITPPPWLSIDGGDRIIHDPAHPTGDDPNAPLYVVDDPMDNPSNADYIATVHPGVGAAIADWLSHEANYQLNLDETSQGGATDSTHALAVARAILGGES